MTFYVKLRNSHKTQKGDSVKNRAEAPISHTAVCAEPKQPLSQPGNCISSFPPRASHKELGMEGKMSNTVVKTAKGLLRGVPQTGEFEGNTVFSGVPYAKPPVGALRFKAPEPADAWDGIRDCDRHASAACQLFHSEGIEPYTSDFYYMGDPEFGEDCLYLEITTGALSDISAAGGSGSPENSADPSGLRPVYLWFHGGGLSTGYSYEVEFDGNILAKKGIVVVSAGTRLNVMGYLALPQLSAEQGGKSGNYGFMDELAALKWVKENIRAFGGDPDNITVGGQSGGSLKVCMLAGSPASNTLIKRAIPESGLKLAQQFPDLASAEAKGRAWLTRCGLDPDISLEELRALPASALYPEGPVGFGELPGEMTFDGGLVPFPCMKEGLAEYAGKIDFLVGTNFGEADAFADVKAEEGSDVAEAMKNRLLTAEGRESFYREILGDLYDRYEFGEKYSRVFSCLEFGSNVRLDNTPMLRARALASLGLAHKGRVNFSRSLMLARLFGTARKEANTWCYLFSHLLPCRPEDYGCPGRDPNEILAYHSSEMFYAFGSLRRNAAGNIPPARPWTEDDVRLADIISSYWANFMRTGDPNSSDLPYWPSAAGDCGWINLGDEISGHTMGEQPFDEMIAEFTKAEYGL